MTREGGKPLLENRDEVGWTASAFDFYAEVARASAGRVIPPIEATQLALVLKEPLGVVACIVPWNYPLLLLAWKVAPALAAGNTIVGKPSELTPLSTLALASCVEHLPPGVVNLVAGRGRRRRARWSTTSDVDGIAFTGSVADREPDRRARGAPRRAREPRAGRQGPVHRLRGRRRRDRDRGARRRVGGVPQRRAGLHVGRALLRRAVGLRAVRRGVRRAHALAARRRSVRPGDRRRADGQRRSSGRRPPRTSRRRSAPARRCSSAARGATRGHFLTPAVLTGAPAATKVLREETFGPVAPIVPVDSLDEALALANDSPTASARTSTRATSPPPCAACASCAPGPCGSTTR